jgi:hypothetical protein
VSLPTKKKGTVSYRAVVRSNAAYAGATSRTVKLTVR